MRSSLSRIPRMLAVVCVCAGMVLASPQRALASGAESNAPTMFSYTVTSPVAGYSLIAGSTISITWTSTNTSSNVNIYLIDDDGWYSFAEIAVNTPDDGQHFWTIPANVPAGPYLIYIENVGVTDWTYGSTFDIHPCGTMSIQPRAPRDTSRPMPRPRPGVRDPRSNPGTPPSPR